MFEKELERPDSVLLIIYYFITSIELRTLRFTEIFNSYFDTHVK